MSEELEPIPSDIIALKLRKLELLEQTIAEREAFPHRHLFKHYKWSREYMDCTNPIQFVCASNQIGKSTRQICKAIELAINPELWPVYWPKLAKGLVPNLFLYFYPDKNTASSEAQFKWPQLLPKDKDHPVHGWKIEWFNKQVSQIVFNTGVTIQFRTYGMDAQNIQAVSAFYIFVDEEPPEEIIPELMMRLNATNGLFSAVFTATRGQEYFRKIIEEKSVWPTAKIWQISMYDCQIYEDGTPSQWTDETIERIKVRCGTEQEVQKRVYGKFVKDTDLKYQSFSSLNICDDSEIAEVQKDWPIFAGLDMGSGGKTGHPAAIVFIACNPEFNKAYVTRTWRGDGVLTTAQDVLTKYIEMRGSDNVWVAAFDWAAKDLGTIAERSGIGLAKAEKSHEIGEQVLNSLFQNQMLRVPREHEQLIRELQSLSNNTDKKRAHDDLCDALRYACVRIPWQWKQWQNDEKIDTRPITLKELREQRFKQEQEEIDAFQDVDSEIDFWAQQLDG